MFFLVIRCPRDTSNENKIKLCLMDEINASKWWSTRRWMQNGHNKSFLTTLATTHWITPLLLWNANLLIPNLKYLVIVATSMNSFIVPTTLSSSHFPLVLLQLHWIFLRITKGKRGSTILFHKPCFQTTMKFAISFIFSSCFIFLVRTTRKTQKYQILD